MAVCLQDMLGVSFEQVARWLGYLIVALTKLAPRDRVGQMMGIWFVAAALGNLVAGGLADRSPTSLFLIVSSARSAGWPCSYVAKHMARWAGSTDWPRAQLRWWTSCSP
jgi:hypothetical protein